MNNNKGEQVFTHNIDDILAKKIITHTEINSQHENIPTQNNDKDNKCNYKKNHTNKSISWKTILFILLATGVLSVLLVKLLSNWKSEKQFSNF